MNAPKELKIKIDCKVQSHFQEKFKRIQTMDSITTEDFNNSLSVEKNYKMIFRAGEGAGASGSFFFFSYDNKFLIKTLKKEEK